MTVNAKDFPVRFSASDRDLSLCSVAPFLTRLYNKIATIGEKFVLYASPSADAVDDTCKMTVQVCRRNSEDEPDSFFHLSAFDEDITDDYLRYVNDLFVKCGSDAREFVIHSENSRDAYDMFIHPFVTKAENMMMVKPNDVTDVENIVSMSHKDWLCDFGKFLIEARFDSDLRSVKAGFRRVWVGAVNAGIWPARLEIDSFSDFEREVIKGIKELSDPNDTLSDLFDFSYVLNDIMDGYIWDNKLFEIMFSMRLIINALID